VSAIKSYRDLVAWQRAFELGLSVYRVTKSFPDHEKYGLTNQLRRAAISIASNIAEGYGRGSRQDYTRFLRVARASLYEIDTQLLFASRLGYTDEQTRSDLQAEVDECGKIIAGLIRRLES